MQAILKRVEKWDTRTVLYILVALTIGSVIVSLIAHLLSGETNWWIWLDGAAQNFSTEIMGAIITFGLFELVINVSNQKQYLIAQMRSPDSTTSANVLEQLREKGWLQDGTLHDVQLIRANLQGARFWNADLRGINLAFGNLKEAKLAKANLQQAQMPYVNLQQADLQQINLEGANLFHAKLEYANIRHGNLKTAIFEKANLENADLENADLEATNMRYANLERAKLKSTNLRRSNLRKANLLKVESIEFAIFDEMTVLPDSTYETDSQGKNLKPLTFTKNSYWTPETDMTRYTDPNHPEFWQPPYLKPNYAGMKPEWLTETQED